MALDNSQFRKEQSDLDDFNKKRKRGLWILYLNEVAAVTSLFLKVSPWIYYILIGYFVFSTLLLIKRILKKRPTDDSNYVFGEKLGNKMNTTPQKFIYEVMMLSLIFIILAGIFSTVYSIFFTDIANIYKVIIGISGVFGALFMLMILITNFQQYKAYMVTEKISKEIFEEEMKGGSDKIREWLKTQE